MVTDPIADFLTSIRNAAKVNKAEVLVGHSRIKSDLAHLFKQEGFVRDVELIKEGSRQKLKITLKNTLRSRAITGIRRISKPGLRRYVGVREIPRVLGGLGTAVLSTPKGVMSGREAKKQNLGGEIVCYIW